MTTTLGKRKRRADIKDPTSPEPTDAASTEHLQALVRKHFEAKYKPLPTLQIVQNAPVASNDLGASESEDSEWEGLDGTKGQAVPVIEHVARPNVGKDAVPKSELKTFMTPKPPLPTPPSQPPGHPPSAKPTDPLSATESALATNDLALHRLLTESHLLSSSSHPSLSPSIASPHISTFNPTPTLTTTRHKAHELRLLSLGAKASLHVQQKMPMSHRKGMEEKKREREEGRRREARENGVVLEKEKKREKRGGGGRGKRERERGVGDPAVGRWKGGMLVLGRRDVESIQGRDGVGSGGRGGRRGRRGRG